MDPPSAEPPPPASVVRFRVDRATAERRVRDELRARVEGPGRAVEPALLTPVLVPAWLVEGRVTGSFTGERGTERHGLDSPAGPDSADYDFTFAPVAGRHDTAFRQLVPAAPEGARPRRMGPAPAEADLVPPLGDTAAAAGLPEPVTRLEATIDEAAARREAATGAESASREAIEREHGGDRPRGFAIDARAEPTAARKVYLPMWRGSYRLEGVAYPVWVPADAPSAPVELTPPPAEVLAALDSAYRAARAAEPIGRLEGAVALACGAAALALLYGLLHDLGGTLALLAKALGVGVGALAAWVVWRTLTGRR